ncbi:hypothetical protein QC764_0075520 [Podospora pseudoanserina]|uniref:Uncharacterized protein n=1 Tax=Podospora pseudoanserina TaxID=2609844 RepID=A0ABR0I4Y3_9PEZI|nr:hypothetical protein QC764_0075520 [Podospora pseudoanserina]
MERPTRRPTQRAGPDKSHSTDLGSTSTGPSHSTTVSTIAVAGAEIEANRQRRLEAEQAAERARQDIERILQRGPLSEERMEELSIAAEEFYRQSMERRRKRQLRELAIAAGVFLVALVAWWAWWRIEWCNSQFARLQ